MTMHSNISVTFFRPLGLYSERLRTGFASQDPSKQHGKWGHVWATLKLFKNQNHKEAAYGLSEVSRSKRR